VQDEFDVVMYNGTSIAIIEIKYRVHQDFLNTLATSKVENFRKLFPMYAKHKIYLGIASMSFNKEVISEAKKLGIGILKQKGDTIEYDTEYMKAY
jgi:Holliday junction resolvase-like predicted endonuclease